MPAQVINIVPRIAKSKAQVERDKQKRWAFESLLSDGVIIRVWAKPTQGFEGPSKLRKDCFLLELSQGLTNARDLKVTDDGFTADLNFDGLWTPVKVTWTGVFALESMNDARVSVWDEDAPAACPL